MSQLVLLPGQDAKENLALEQALFETCPENGQGYFLLWQNSPAVIIGRHQWPDEETNQDLLRALRIPVVRRISGGGAVYHDSGSLNFSFIMPQRAGNSFCELMLHLCSVLNGAGIAVKLAGRNDLEICGKKVCGSAHYLAKGKILVHGTLLVNTDLERLSSVLAPARSKLARHGVASARSRVANLADFYPAITVAKMKQLLADSFCQSEVVLTSGQRALAARIASKRYTSPEWNYGKCSGYEYEKRRRFKWGEVVLRVGRGGNGAWHCAIGGDFFCSADIAELAQQIAGFLSDSTRPMPDLPFENYFSGCAGTEIREFLQDLLVDGNGTGADL